MLSVSTTCFLLSTTLSNAECIDLQSLSDGIVFEYTAPKGKLYEVSIDAGHEYVLRTGYTSISPDREKIIYKSFLGLFTTESWHETQPDNVTQYAFNPSLDQFPILTNGVAFDYQETWTNPELGKFVADRTLKVLSEKETTNNGCTYKVQEIEVRSVVKLPNGKESEQYATFLYIPELYFKDGAFTFYDSRNMLVRTASENDFVPQKKN